MLETGKWWIPDRDVGIISSNLVENYEDWGDRTRDWEH